MRTTLSSGHHRACPSRSRVELAQVARVGAVLLVGLHVDAVGAVVEVEVVHVGRARGTPDSASVTSRSGSVEAARAVAVDLDHELRVVGAEAREEPDHLAALVRRARRAAPAASGQAARCRRPSGRAARTGSRRRPRGPGSRRRERDHERVRDRHQRPAHTAQAPAASEWLLPLALAVVLEAREDQAVVRRRAAEAEADHREGGARCPVLNRMASACFGDARSCSRATRRPGPG